MRIHSTQTMRHYAPSVHGLGNLLEQGPVHRRLRLVLCARTQKRPSQEPQRREQQGDVHDCTQDGVSSQSHSAKGTRGERARQSAYVELGEDRLGRFAAERQQRRVAWHTSTHTCIECTPQEPNHMGRSMEANTRPSTQFRSTQLDRCVEITPPGAWWVLLPRRAPGVSGVAFLSISACHKEKSEP